jgi:hypothetical protein
VCRKSYINPAVFEAWQAGRLSRRGASRKSAQALLALLARAKN